MEALSRRAPGVRLEIFTTVPSWFFEDSLDGAWSLHSTRCDLGLVQLSPTEVDLDATIRSLEAFFPFEERRLDELAESLVQRSCRCVVSDISPLGIAVAARAGVPSILVENFTWDWIYEGYLDADSRFEPFVAAFSEVFESATLRLQAEPISVPRSGSIEVGLVSRQRREDPAAVRERLGLADGETLVLITMGGVSTGPRAADRLGRLSSTLVVLPTRVERAVREGSLLLLPERSPIFVPDLVAAADVVVGKAGYSTVAETVSAGTRYAIVERRGFAETAVLTRFARDRLPSIELSTAEYESGDWLNRLPELLARERAAPYPAQGADRAALEIGRFLGTGPPENCSARPELR